MSFATLIILFLLIATIVGTFLVGATLIRNIKGTSTASDTGASTPLSSSTPPSSPAPAGKGGGNWQDKARKINWSVILLGVAGIYLLARMTVLGGVLPVEEILILAIITGIAVLLNKNTLVFALLIGTLLLVNFFHPNVNQDVKGVREAQLNPPGEMSPIVINRDGEYDLPDRPLKICFTLTGDPNQNFYLDNKVEIGGKLFIQREAGCPDLPSGIKGKISISLLSGKPYSEKIKSQIGMTDVNNNYEYYKKIGFGEYPTIFAK
jgi:hypothetical protein